MSIDSGRWHISDRVVYEFVQDEAVALNLKSGTYYRLNAVAASALRHLVRGAELRNLTDRLLEEFDVGRATLAADLADLLTDFEKYGLVVREP